MKKIIILTVSVLLLAACSTQQTLYSWGNYENASYNYLKNNDELSTQELIKAYQEIIDKQKGKRGAVPPGIYADYGFILLQANRTEEGKAMLLKEISLYPESKVFIERILKMTEK
ncbi:MAG: DUF4810 domain-containing protein [Paludibacter sp.]|nr:DUF4810 domain-containing protein [Paludibacter sp.]